LELNSSDRRLEVALRRAAALAHDLPEHRVVGVAAAVVAHGGADVLGQLRQLGEDLFNRHGRDLGMVFHCLVELLYIRGVMLVVMKLHGLRVDRRLERREVIRQRRQLERAGLLRRQDDPWAHGRRDGSGGDTLEQCATFDRRHGSLLGGGGPTARSHEIMRPTNAKRPRTIKSAAARWFPACRALVTRQ
jgi:hypothetical protein